MSRRLGSAILVWAGLLAMIGGAVDPLEGSLVILPGAGLVALGAWLGRSGFTRVLAWAFVLVAVGVAVLFALSAAGGIGGPAGGPAWWAIALVPYPVGWGMAVIGAIRRLRERPAATGDREDAAPGGSGAEV